MSKITYTRPALDINGRPYHPYLSPFCPQFKSADDFPAPPEGYFLLPEKGVNLKDERTYEARYLRSKCWHDLYTAFSYCDPVKEYRKYQGCGPNAAKINESTVRLYDAMQAYKSRGQISPGFPSLKTALAEPVTGESPDIPVQNDANCVAEIAELKRQIAELKRQIEELKKVEICGENSAATVNKNPAPDDFAAGDWVVCIDSEDSGLKSGGVYKIREIVVNSSFHIILEGLIGTYWKRRFRHAAPAEIEAHLKPKFNAGDYVVCTTVGSIWNFKPKSLSLNRVYKLTKGEHKNPGNYHDDEGKTFVGLVDDSGKDWTFLVDRFRHATPEEIDAHLNKVVIRGGDGCDYTAEYHRGYVAFGCAKIDNGMIRSLFYFCQYAEKGNRTVVAVTLSSVTIGSGVFKPEDLEKLVENLID